MFGFRFIKTQPTQYLIQYRDGIPRRQGAGLAFWYYAPSSSIVVVPTASVNEPFIFPEITADFQEVTVQGQITYRVADPSRTAALLNFTVGPRGTYVSEDPQKLSQRLIDQVQVAMRAEVQVLPLKDVLASGEALVDRVLKLLRSHPMIGALGLELLGLSLRWLKSLYAGWAGAATALGVTPPSPALDAAFPWDADFLHYFVREPFPSRTTGATLVAGRIPAPAPVTIVSEMAENGVIFSDGIEADFLQFNAGTRATIGVAERQGLLVA